MKKGEILVIVVAILITIFIIFMLNKKRENTKNETQLNEINTNQPKIEYNEDEEKYVVYDGEGKEIYNGTSEVEANFYKDNPDFDPMIEQFDSNEVAGLEG